MTKLHELAALGQSVWLDNLRRAMLTSGELQQLVDEGLGGVTSNPTIFEKAITGSTDYDEAIGRFEGDDLVALYESLALEDIGGAADALRPLYNRLDGGDGFVSLEVNPGLAHDTEGTIAEARRLWAALGRPNVMIKAPATAAGIPAIQRLIAEGVNVNVTLLFSVEVYRQVAEAFLSGLEERVAAGEPVRQVASVASFFVSRVDTAVDRLLATAGPEGRGGQGRTAVANAKVAYEQYKALFSGGRWEALRPKGARPQRLLWASTGVKNPNYSDLLYVESLIGPDTVNTVPPATLSALKDHGRVARTLDQDVDEARRTLAQAQAAGIDLEAITERLTEEGVASFRESFERLLAGLAEKRARLQAQRHGHAARLDPDSHAAVDALLDEWQREGLIGRIWARDHTVWRPEPTELANRLGWLNVAEEMMDEADELMAFGEEIRQAGYSSVVLLGMGGSSLTAEVLRASFMLGGERPGFFPALHVLDSTVPGWVGRVDGAIGPARTLFIVSSKSGGTIEVMSLFKFFYERVRQARPDDPGRNFVAITDAGSGLQRLAEERGFRRVFLANANIGGRYSALSHFGMAPAAVAGLDVRRLLDRGWRMAESCASCVPGHDNPGAWLGATLGVLARRGRDKVTFITSPGIASFGLWAEQLIAESTGKEGTGILPIALEPMAPADAYGPDRVFAYLRLRTGYNDAADSLAAALEQAGQPVIRLELDDLYDLAAEFFRWMFATALAGKVLGIQPFDQPDVQLAKDMTAVALEEVKRSGRPPALETRGALADLLAQARPGDYLAILAFLDGSEAVDDALDELRRAVLLGRRLPTTMGYGPRYLHSTGQLHKGGPNNGLFLQLVADYEEDDLSVPGEAYSFGGLVSSQAAGDMRALESRGRRVARVNLGREVIEGLKGLVAEVGSSE